MSELSFPKKSYFKKNEVLSILGFSSQELRSKISDGLSSFFSESGQKLFLREDVIALYAMPSIVNKVITEVKPVATKVESDNFENLRSQFNGALELIAQIKSSRSEIWHSL